MFSFKISRSVLNQLIATSLCNFGVMISYSSFAWLEPITTWLTSEESEIRMTSSNISWLSAFISLGEFVSGAPSGILADRWGRKKVMLAVAPISILAWLIAIFTRNLFAMFIIRLVQGFTLGITMTVAPTYIAEVSSASVRGALGGLCMVFIYLGILYTYCISYYVSYSVYLYIQAVVPLLYLFSFVLMPESPYYYFMVNKNKEAVEALSWLRGYKDVADEAQQIQRSVQEDLKQKKNNFKDLFATKSDRRAFLIVQIVNIGACMTGVQTITVYAKQIFETTKLLWFTPEQLTIVMAAILCLSSFIAAFIVDIIGRKALLIVSSFGVAISNLMICVFYYLAEMTTINIEPLIWINYVGIFGLCVLTNIGMGDLLHIMQGEFFPSHTRSIGGGVTSLIGSATIFISIKMYQPISNVFGVYMNFASYALISFIVFIFTCLYVTESAKDTLEDINLKLKQVTNKK